ncbi:rod-binding protein [Roseococcus sp. YIM B11640]|uniref:rod-binding protein n=1 Tax=Roseococcus sp. YIM B11640 TaxID=3133973 RepID=UPI003C7B924A
MLSPVAGAATAQSPARMREVAQRFEAQVLAQLLQPAFDSVAGEKSAFGGGAAEAQWRPMLVEAFAAGAARSGNGIGLQEMVLGQMIRLQEQGERSR